MRLVSKLSVATGIIALALVPIAHAVSVTQLYITPANTLGWADVSVNGGSTSFVDGAPTGFGVASLQMQTDNSFTAQAAYLESPGITLAQLTQASYWTKQLTTLNLSQTANLVMDVDLNGDYMADTTLTYNPSMQPGGAPVQNNVWQYWDATNGEFVSSKTYGSLTAGSSYSLSTIKQLYPAAQILIIGLQVGPNTPSSVIDVDGLTLGTAVYDFERVVPTQNVVDVPKTIQDCKKYGWESLFMADGSGFKNQGQCVSYIVSSKAKVQ